MKCTLVIASFIFLSFNLKAEEISLDQYGQKPFGQILFVRHALAPGFGDPPNFNIENCATQRNLNEEGRLQAISLGTLFKNNGISFSRIYSSEWCRCRETAQLMGLGQVVPLSGLNSFFQNIVPKERSLSNLMRTIKALKESDQTTLMVTHYVTILAVTGIAVESGNAVAYDYISETSKKLIF